MAIDSYRYLRHFFIVITENICDIEVEGEEDEDICILEDMCDIYCFNKNKKLNDWRSYKLSNGIYLLACNEKPDINYNEFIETYKKYIKKINIYYSSEQLVKVYPWFHNQDYAYKQMERIFKKFELTDHDTFKMIVNYSNNNTFINIVDILNLK